MTLGVKNNLIRVMAGILLCCMVFSFFTGFTVASAEEIPSECTCEGIDGIHVLPCPLAVTNTEPVDEPVDETTTPVDVEEPTLFEQIMACSTAPEMLKIVMFSDLSVLTTEEKQTIAAKVATFEQNEETEAIYILLDTPATTPSSPQDTSSFFTTGDVTTGDVTTGDVTPAATGTPSITAGVYFEDTDVLNNISPITQLVTPDSGAISSFDNWKQGEIRYVHLNATNLSDAYEIVLEMQPIIVRESDTDASINVGVAKPEYTPNIMDVNTGGTLVADNYSGTFVWTIPKTTDDLSFGFTIKFDESLWNKLAGPLNDVPEEKPLLSLSIREVSTGNVVSNVVLHQATTPHNWKTQNIYEDLRLVINKKGAESVFAHKSESIILGLNRMVSQSSYTSGFYYPCVDFVIHLPQYTSPNGDTYYLTYNGSTVDCSTNYGRVKDIECIYNEDEHTVRVRVFNYYTTHQNQFTGMQLLLDSALRNLSSSQMQSLMGLGQDVTEIDFKGKLEIYTYRQSAVSNIDGEYVLDSEAVGEKIDMTRPAEQPGTFVVTYNFSDNYLLEATGTTGLSGEVDRKVVDKTNCESTTDESIAFNLGFYGIRNVGKGDSPKLTVSLLFDGNNYNLIHVTGINLMADHVSDTIDVTYTLIDKDGNLYVDAEGNSAFTINVPNTCKEGNGVPEGTWLTNPYVMLTRSMLPTEHQGYYFKSIQYDIATIRAGGYMYNQSACLSREGAGTIWGYANPEAYGINNNADIVVKVTDSNEKPIDEICRTLQTRVRDNPTSAYYLDKGQVYTADTQPSDSAEIVAGDSVTVSAKIVVSEYPYAYTGYLKNIRVALVLPQGISIKGTDSVYAFLQNNMPVECISVVPYEASDGENIVWVLEFFGMTIRNGSLYYEEGPTLGYYTENLDSLSAGSSMTVDITLKTHETMTEKTFYLTDIFFAAGDGQLNNVGGGYKDLRRNDPLDINGVTSSSDKVAGFNENDRSVQFTVKEKAALLEITDAVKETDESGQEEAVGSQSGIISAMEDYVVYDLYINCVGSGTASDFYYIIPIPKEKFAIDTSDDFVAQADISLALAGIPQVLCERDQVYQILYSTADPSILYYDTAASEAITWYTESEITSLESVTMIKICTLPDHFIELGNNAVVSVKLKYGGTNTESYAAEAGGKVSFSSRGQYLYSNNNLSLKGTYSTAGVSISTQFSPEVWTIKLTAGTKVDSDKKKQTIEFNIPFATYKTYEIRNVAMTGVTLVSSTTDIKNSNTDFVITATLDARYHTSTVNLLEIPAGESIDFSGAVMPEDDSLKFTFTLDHGDAITDSISTRFVTFDIIGNDGIIINVTINIEAVATQADPQTPQISIGKIYSPFPQSTNTSISRGSAFTALFVANNLIPDNYSGRTLIFSVAPVEGTTIIMIDWTNRSSPEYYHYTVTADDAANDSLELPLAGTFTAMAGTADYVEPTGETPIDESFIFVVDFPDSDTSPGSEIKGEIKLSKTFLQGEQTVETLKYTVGKPRTFSLTGDKTSLIPGEEFTLTYSNAHPGYDDNRYGTRQMTLVVTGNDNIPDDATLRVGNTEYHLNANGQFIIPLGNLSNEIDIQSINKTVSFSSQMIKEPVTLTFELYVSATSNAEQPFAGHTVASSHTVTVTVPTTPSIKILGLFSNESVVEEKRIFATYEDKSVVLKFDTLNVTEDHTVILQIQKKRGQGYIAGSLYLTSVDNTLVIGTEVEIPFEKLVEASSSGIALKFSSQNLTQGTYRVYIEIEDKDGNVIVSEPYNFLVLNDVFIN